MRKCETTAFALWPDIIAPVLPPVTERTYNVADIAKMVRDEYWTRSSDLDAE